MAHVREKLAFRLHGRFGAELGFSEVPFELTPPCDVPEVDHHRLGQPRRIPDCPRIALQPDRLVRPVTRQEAELPPQLCLQGDLLQGPVHQLQDLVVVLGLKEVG